MFQDFSSGKPGVWVSPLGGNLSLWSLSYEWWFYMMFFPVNRYIPAHQQLNAVATLSIIGYITYQVAPNQISLFLMYFLLWWSGVELARTYMSKQSISYRTQRSTLIYLSALTILLAIPCMLAAIRREPVTFGVHPILEFRHFAACLIFIGIGIAWKKVGWKYFSALLGIFSLIAPISYAMYVLHYPLAVSSSYLSDIESKWQQGLLYVVITLLLAYFAEVPFQNAINRRFPIGRIADRSIKTNKHSNG